MRSTRHGSGVVRSFFHAEGYGWVYWLTLDSGYSTGGAVEECRLEKIA